MSTRRYSFSEAGYVIIGSERLDDVVDASYSIADGDTEVSETFAAGDDKVHELEGKSSQIVITLNVECYDAKGISGTFNKFRVGTDSAKGKVITVCPTGEKKTVFQAVNTEGMKLKNKNKAFPVAKNFPPASFTMEWTGKFDEEPAEVAVT